MLRMGLLGKKVGMTQIFVDGERMPVTVIELGPNVVVQKKTKDTKDGYDAIQLGFGDKEHRKVNKPMKGHFEKSDVKPKWFIKEIRLPEEKIGAFEVGQEIKADVFAEGQWVDITGTSKGKGFQGVMKKHNMKGAKQATHGTHEQFRHVGSIGCRTTPGEVNKGKRLPGQMGNKTVTVQNVKIVKLDLEKNLCMVLGSVPGAPDGYVMVRHAVKKLGKMGL
ncbi:MAG: 50S ribosomal protein L3 [Myxococcales bacterium]|nr:50S ribosomal protein L3 [Myxococcales bacterium]